VINSPSRYALAIPNRVLASRGLLLTKLSSRFLCLAVLFALELIVISIRLDTQALEGKTGLLGAVGNFGPSILQSLVAFTTVFLTFGYANAKEELSTIRDRLVGVPLGWSFLAVHSGSMVVFAFLSTILFGGTPRLSDNLIASAWLATGILGIVTALFFFIPPKTVHELLRNVGSAWIYAASAAALIPGLVTASKQLWKPTTALTFEIVKSIVKPLVSGFVADPAAKTIGTQKFTVQIAPSCSGLEGMGLILVFGVLWLWFFRDEYKFPRALLLIPFAMGLMFLLNAVRIAALILIGDAGARNVAVGGFHSQAGWIAFNGVALGLACVAHRVPWITSRRAIESVDDRPVENAAAAYLVPFLAVLAAAMISRATTASFEWLYPLRFVATAGALLLFRRQYSSINWRFGWAAPVVGGLVFVLWLSLDRIAGARTVSVMPTELAAWPAPARITWLVIRVLAAVVTVPIAEELAFRGFLLRRLISADFDSVSFQRWTLWAVFASSIIFGLLHSDRWIAGSIAGMLYASAQKWRGRIGDAIVAHGVTNALIAVSVLWSGNWSLW